MVNKSRALILGALFFAPMSPLLFAQEAGDDIAFVTNQNSSDVSIVDLKNRQEIKRVNVPGRAAGIHVTKDRFYTISPDDGILREYSHQGELCREALIEEEGGTIGIVVYEQIKRAYISEMYGREINIIDLITFAKIKNMDLGQTPTGLDISPDGTLLAVALRDDNEIAILDTKSEKLLGKVGVGEHPFGLSFSPSGLVFSADVLADQVSIVDPQTLKLIGEIPSGERPYAVAFANGHGFISDQYAEQVTIFDLENYEVQTQIPTGEYPEGMSPSLDETEIYVANWFENQLSILDTKTMQNLGAIEVGDGPRAFGHFVAPYSIRSCDDPLQ